MGEQCRADLVLGPLTALCEGGRLTFTNPGQFETKKGDMVHTALFNLRVVSICREQPAAGTDISNHSTRMNSGPGSSFGVRKRNDCDGDDAKEEPPPPRKLIRRSPASSHDRSASDDGKGEGVNL